MDIFTRFEQFNRQLSDLQKNIFNTWEATISNMRTINILNFPENFENTVKLQQELVNNSLELQEQVSRLSIDTQRKIWNSYFQMFQR